MKSFITVAALAAFTFAAIAPVAPQADARISYYVKKKARKGPVHADFTRGDYRFVCMSYGDCGNWNIK